MKILIINFNLKNLGVDDFKAQAHIDAMDFRGVEGLISKYFIGDDIRLDPVMLDKQTTIEELLLFYMGKNTPDRQKFIINNLKVELDYADETIELAQ